ncbi:MAG: protein-export chaperone SecB [Proteobacteria bacterium]|nr:protein-export chaperone SecB [Pseudomonadota bacterium]
MSDSPIANGAQEAASQEPLLAINGQYLKDLTFENPSPLESLRALDSVPEAAVSVDIQAVPLDAHVFEVSLKLSVNAQHKDKTVYVAEVDYAGIFTLSSQIPDEHRHALLMIEGPRLLFPFVRALLVDVSREGGYPPLSLMPIDFVAIYAQQQQQMAQEAGVTPAPKADA